MKNSVQQKMFKVIGRWQQSGISQKAWCSKHNIAYATFHYWYKRYREQAPVPAKESPDGFIKLSVNDRVPVDCWCELAFAKGKRLIFQQPVSAEFLRILVD